MGQKICGIDLGSHSVKASLYQSKFRKFQLVAFREILLARTSETSGVSGVTGADYPSPLQEPNLSIQEDTTTPLSKSLDGKGDESESNETAVSHIPPKAKLLTDSQKNAVKELLSDRTFKADTTLVALPGTSTIIRYLRFPFSDEKKISPVVGYELEGQIPFELDEVAYDHMILELGRPTKGIETRVLAAATPYDEMESFLSELEGLGLDPNIVTIAPLAYGFLGKDPESGDSDHSEELTCVLDIGHKHTNLCILKNQQPVFMRTLSRGGANITTAISKKLNISLEEAEHLKRQEGTLLDPGETSDHNIEALDAIIKKSLRPWDLSLRQSITAATTDLGSAPSSFVLCGGSSQLKGIEHHIANITGLPTNGVKRVSIQTLEGQGPEATLSYGLAHLIHSHRRDILNLRKGGLAPISNRSIFREKALVFSVAAVIALGLLMTNGWAKLARLKKEERVLSTQLYKETQTVLGKPMTNEAQVLNKIRRLRRSSGGTTLPIPNSSAYAILSEISRKAPPSDKVTLDVRKMNIRSRKLTISGTAGSASEVEEFVTSLKEIDCFKTVKPGTTTEVGSEDDKKSEFTINIESECM